jgi:ComF family protein
MYLVSASNSNSVSLALVHRFKYSGSVWLAPVMAGLIDRALSASPLAAKEKILVPIPLHPVRKRERGYNQSLLLARELSNLTGMEVREILSRKRRTKTQTALDVDQRRDNVRGAFIAVCDCDGLETLIVDDVATSGATILEAARAIRSAGGAVAGAVTFVRA